MAQVAQPAAASAATRNATSRTRPAEAHARYSAGVGERRVHAGLCGRIEGDVVGGREVREHGDAVTVAFRERGAEPGEEPRGRHLPRQCPFDGEADVFGGAFHDR